MTMMQTPGRHEHQDVLLDGTIDDMLLRLRGLVLVGGLLEQRGSLSPSRPGPSGSPALPCTGGSLLPPAGQLPLVIV